MYRIPWNLTSLTILIFVLMMCTDGKRNPNSQRCQSYQRIVRTPYGLKCINSQPKRDERMDTRFAHIYDLRRLKKQREKNSSTKPVKYRKFRLNSRGEWKPPKPKIVQKDLSAAHTFISESSKKPMELPTLDFRPKSKEQIKIYVIINHKGSMSELKDLFAAASSVSNMFSSTIATTPSVDEEVTTDVEYESGDDSVVKSHLTTLAPINRNWTFVCDKREGFFPDIDNDCRAYYQCSGRGRQRFQCPPGTKFDSHSLVCNWSDNVQCDSNVRIENHEKISTTEMPLITEPEDTEYET